MGDGRTGVTEIQRHPSRDEHEAGWLGGRRLNSLSNPRRGATALKKSKLREEPGAQCGAQHLARESRMPGSVRAKPNGIATRPSPPVLSHHPQYRLETSTPGIYDIRCTFHVDVAGVVTSSSNSGKHAPGACGPLAQSGLIEVPRVQLPSGLARTME